MYGDNIMIEKYLSGFFQNYFSKCNKIVQLTEDAIILKQNKKYKKAIKYMNKALIILNKTNDKMHISKGFLLKNIGNCLFNLGKYKEAINKLNIASKIYNLIEEDSTNDLYDVYFDLYNCYFEISDYVNIINFGLKAIECSNSETIKNAKILASVARFHLMIYFSNKRVSNLIRGLHYNTESKKMFDKLNETNTLDYAYCVYDCAELFYYLEDIDSAIKFYEITLNLAMEINKCDNLLYGIYFNLSNIYKEKGYIDTMLFYINKAKKLSIKLCKQ